MRPVVDRFVAGTDLDAALPVIAGLAADRLVTVDHLGENVSDRAGIDATVDAYRDLLLRLTAEGLADQVEVSVKLSAVGQGLPDGDALALDGVRAICEAAAEAGTTVTVDMEDHTTTDATLATVVALRADFPWVAAVLQSQLRRTEGDCRDLAGPGSRVRLCKGAYDEPESVAFTDRADVDRSYVRCLKILFAGEGLPLVATHDPRLVAIAQHLGRDHPYELQMLYGVRPGAQVDLAAAGERMRVYVPYGTQWYGYFMRRLAERPANVAFFLRALATRG
jgi:proline dehydrogenase